MGLDLSFKLEDLRHADQDPTFWMTVINANGDRGSKAAGWEAIALLAPSNEECCGEATTEDVDLALHVLDMLSPTWLPALAVREIAYTLHARHVEDPKYRWRLTVSWC